MLHMMRMGKHIDSASSHCTVMPLCHKKRQVSCLCRWIATDIDDALWSRPQDHLHDGGIHTCTWRVGHQDLGTTMRCDEVIGQDRFHIACVEGGVRDPVLIPIDKGIFDSLWYILDPDDGATALRQVVGN